MIRIFFGILLLCGTTAALEGPDFMLTNRIYSADDYYFSLLRQPTDNYNFDLTFEDASLYGLSSLKWNFVGARFDYGAASLSICYRTYGINDLYESPTFSVYAQKGLKRIFWIGAGLSRRDLCYGDNLYRTAQNMLLLGGGIKFARIDLSAYLENSSILSKSLYSEKTEGLITASWLVQETLTFSLSVYSDRQHHQRIALGQYLGLTDQLAINAGLLSDPEIFFAGFEFIYRGFILGYTYYDIGGLPDCSKLTLAYRQGPSGR